MEKDCFRKIILFDADALLYLIPSFAALINKYRDATIVPIYPSYINGWQIVEEHAETELVAYWRRKGVQIQTADRDLPIRLYLLGIYPRNADEMPLLWQFAEENADQIELWADNHIWPDLNYLDLLSRQCPNLKVSPGKSMLEMLDAAGYPSPPDWKGMEYSLAKDMADIYENDDRSFRIASAFYAALSVENATGYYTIIPSAYLILGEILTGNYNREVNRLIRKFENIADVSERAWEKIETTKEFELAGRPIAFSDIGRVAKYVDIDAIADQLLEEYPWLCGIRTNDLFYIHSNILDMNEIYSSYEKFNLDANTLWKIAKAEVKTFGKHRRHPRGDRVRRKK